MVGLGVLVLIGWLARDFFMATEIPSFIRIVVGIVTVAIVVLLGIVIRDRIAQIKKNDFKEVEQ